MDIIKSSLLICPKQHFINGLPKQLKRIENSTLILVPRTIITSSSSQKISLFTIDSSLFEAHISQLSKTCCAHIHDLHCLCLDIKTNSAIAILIVHSKLHYCISFHNLPKTSIFKLQLNQNAFIRTVTKSPKFWHISPLLKSPHWLITVKCKTGSSKIQEQRTKCCFSISYISEMSHLKVSLDMKISLATNPNTSSKSIPEMLHSYTPLA